MSVARALCSTRLCMATSRRPGAVAGATSVGPWPRVSWAIATHAHTGPRAAHTWTGAVSRPTWASPLVRDGMRPARLAGSPAAGAGAAPSGVNSVFSSVGAVRRMGIIDSIQTTLDGRKTKKTEEMRTKIFTAQVEYLASVPEFTMLEHITMTKDVADNMGLTGWKSKMRSSSAQQELLDKYPEVLICDHLQPKDIADHQSIKRKQKRRIATECGVGVDIVNRFLRSFDSNLMLHRFLHGRKARGLPLPTTQEEYSQMMVNERGGLRGRDARKSFGRVRSPRAALRRSR